MKDHALTITAKIQISKPPHDVYEAIADPDKMKNYFIAASTGRMEEGKHLSWRFPEFDVDVPVRVGKMERHSYISYYWDDADKELLVEMTLERRDGNATLVTVTEKGMDNDEASIKWLKSNTEGWANFLACLKAYLEYGINLRKGAFDFMRQEATK